MWTVITKKPEEKLGEKRSVGWVFRTWKQAQLEERKTFYPGKNYQSPAAYLQPLTKMEKWLKAFKGSRGFPFTGSDTLNSRVHTHSARAYECVWGSEGLMEILACARCWKAFQMKLSYNQQNVSSLNIVFLKEAPDCGWPKRFDTVDTRGQYTSGKPF